MAPACKTSRNDDRRQLFGPWPFGGAGRRRGQGGRRRSAAARPSRPGVKAGDYITHLDGKLYYGGDLDEAVAKMRGAAGTSIRLTIFRPGRDEPFDVTVTRGVIDLEPVTWKLEKRHDRGHYHQRVLARCRQGCERRGAGAEAAAGRAGQSGLVLDLRSNPGGSLDEAVALSDLFLDQRRHRFAARPHHQRKCTITAPKACSRAMSRRGFR
jgi:C-terminal processing protease CtpA/Prc